MFPQLCVFFVLVLIECHGYESSWSSEYQRYGTPQDVMVHVVNNLALKLLATHNEGNDNNIAISPYGALSVLVALKEGVRGDAADEIHQASGIPSDLSVVRVGLRDIHRHLKSYFIPEEGFLSGLTLSHDNVTLHREYEDILRFYGFDINAFNNALDFSTTESPITSTEISSTTTEIGTSTIEMGTSTIEMVTASTEEAMLGKEMVSTTTESETTTEAARVTRSEAPTTAETTIKPEKMLTTVDVVITTTTYSTSASTERLTTIANTETTSVNKIPEAVTLKASTEAPESSTKIGTEAASTTKALSTTQLTTSESTTLKTNETIVGLSSTLVELSSTVAESASTVTEAPSTVTEATSTVTEATSTVTEASTTVTEPSSSIAEATETSLTTESMSSTESTSVDSSDGGTTENLESTSSDLNDPSENDSESSSLENSTNIVQLNDETTKYSNESKVNDTLRRDTRSVVDYIIARYYDEHAITQRPPPYNDESDLYFLINGKHKESNINYMTYDTVLPFYYISHLNTLALRFPLDSSKYYLLLLLPEDPQQINKLICDLRLNTSLKYITDNLRYTHVKAVIPSFMLKGYVVLTPTFQKMGITSVFEPRQADFSPMTTDRGLYVTNIEQAITVNIRNYVDLSTMNNNRYLHRSNPVIFKADHPFLYFVIDSQIDVTLMAGKIVNPLNSRIR